MRKLLESQEKHFSKGGKFEKFYPLYEATYSFLYGVPKIVTEKGPHVRDNLDTKRYMIIVIISLLPVILFSIFNTGYQAHLLSGLTTDFWPVVWTGLKIFLPILVVSYAVGGLWEVLFAILRKHEINEGFLVTGMLFPLILPPTIPLWQVALGISFGVVVGKEIFGGTGKNFLNPALTARAFLFFTYPAYMSGDPVWVKFMEAKSTLVDVVTGATPLSVAANTPAGTSAVAALQNAGYTLEKMFWGFIPGSIGETSAFCALLGAAILIITGVGSWRTMLACVVGVVSTSLLFSWLAMPENVPILSLPPQWHLVMGGFAFGAVFMATDPVSAPGLNLSKLIYGFLIGFLTVVIRAVNPAYPEGVMLSILLMNVFAPLIDYFVIAARLRKRIPNAI